MKQQSNSEGKEREKLARRVKKLEQENADIVEGYEYEVRQLLGRNAALEMEVESLSAELDLHLKAKSSDRRYGRYDSGTFKPTSRHQQGSYSSKPSPSHCKVTPEQSQSHKKPKRKRKTYSSKDSGGRATGPLV